VKYIDESRHGRKIFKPMFAELDDVVLIKDIPDIKKGTEGAIVYDYKNGATFIVEFFKDGETLAVVELDKSCLTKDKSGLKKLH
jgi:hypothetical protein